MIETRLTESLCHVRNMSSKARIVSTLRNTLLLSLLLGVTWITGAIPTSTVSLYISVVLNASQGVYILIYSVLANTQVRGEVRERMSGVVSTYMVSSNQSKVGVSSQSQTIKFSFPLPVSCILYYSNLRALP